jgi:hypothetical protein
MSRAALTAAGSCPKVIGRKDHLYGSKLLIEAAAENNLVKSTSLAGKRSADDTIQSKQKELK